MTAEARGGADAGGHPSPWFRAAPGGHEGGPYDGTHEGSPGGDSYGEGPYGRGPYGEDAYLDGSYSDDSYSDDSYGVTGAAASVPSGTRDGRSAPAWADGETIGLRAADTRRAAGTGRPEPVTAGGRAARRRAAKRKGRRGARPRSSAGAEDGTPKPATGAPPGQAPERPLTRVEARRAARAAKPGPATVASRAIGEVFITIGVLMLLFVTYQLWWTNIRAQQQADAAARELQEDWAEGKGKPGAFEAGQGFALLHIPKLDVVVPVAEGIDKHRVLDRGMVGHYNKGATKTPMPQASSGNFGLAGHRNTHGEPFRYINRLDPGDPIVVETQDTYFVYKMASILPQTGPGNTAVLDAVPRGSGFTRPGRYITLTTCTPEFTSKYRMIVWGKMVEERPRDKGKPPALVD